MISMEGLCKMKKAERKTRLVEILSRGLVRCVNNSPKSRYISDLRANKHSLKVSYMLDSSEVQSVDGRHENPKY